MPQPGGPGSAHRQDPERQRPVGDADADVERHGKSVGEEFWQIEALVRNKLYWGPFGIPIVPIALIGRVPIDLNAIGSRERCEAADPTELCKGPFYFRRDKAEAGKWSKVIAP